MAKVDDIESLVALWNNIDKNEAWLKRDLAAVAQAKKENGKNQVESQRKIRAYLVSCLDAAVGEKVDGINLFKQANKLKTFANSDQEKDEMQVSLEKADTQLKRTVPHKRKIGDADVISDDEDGVAKRKDDSVGKCSDLTVKTVDCENF